jgi:acetyl esterase/lipase
LPIYIFYHGGGFIYGTLDSEDAACSRIVAAMDIIVVHVCYRHTPQHPFPAAHNDALDAFDWIVENAEAFGGDVANVIVGGVSAGANLAVTVALARNAKFARECEINEIPAIKGLSLISPWLIINEEKISYEAYASKEKASRVQCADAPVVSAQVLKFFVDCIGEAVREKIEVDPDVGLVSEEKLRVLPSTTIIVAGSDPLRDEGILFAQRLHKNK